MDTILDQVLRALAGHKIATPQQVWIDDLSFIRAHYGHQKFGWALDIVIRAYRDRLKEEVKEWKRDHVEAFSRGLLGRYLNPLIMMLLCEADEATGDEWVERFGDVEVVDVYTKCLRKAAVEFEVRLRKLKI